MESPRTISEELLLQLTDCDHLDQIKVISLRNKQLRQVFQLLCSCSNIQIAYLQGNAISSKDLEFMKGMHSLRRLDLSNN
jgi:Leucine-rich repeat (LRR) protein